MALNGFISGPGPFYQLEGAAPASEGQVLASGADGVARWGAPPGGADVYQRGGVVGVTADPGGIEVPAPLILVAYSIQPARVPQGSQPGLTDGSEVRLYLTPSLRELTATDGIANSTALTVLLPELPFPLEFGGAGSALLGGTWIVEIDGAPIGCDFELRQVGGAPALTVHMPVGVKQFIKTQAVSLWYLSSTPP